MKKYKNRSEVPEKYKWDLTDFFKDDQEYNRAYDKCVKMIDELKNYVGCTKDADKLMQFLTKEIDTIALWENLYVYAYLINDQELGIDKNIERKNKSINLNNMLTSAISFFAPELLKLSKEEYKNLFTKNSKLLEYKDDLDKIYRDKDHILDEDKEVLVSSLVTSMNHFSDMSANMLNKEHNYGKVKLEDNEIVQISTTNFGLLMKNPDVKIRKKVYNSFYKVIDQYGVSSASFLNSYVNMNNTLAKIYNHSSAWDSKIFSLNMPNEAYEKLIESVENNLSALRKYYDLKRKVLKLDKLHVYDLSLELAKSVDEYSIEDAQQMIRDSLKPLGSEYIKCFDKIIDNRYIDYCQYQGKCSGGYSFNTLDRNSRILMSFNGDLDSVSTIAHESGHNVHHQFISKYNPLVYRDVSTLVAEVASLTNECLLSSYLANNGKNNREKLAGIANILGVIVSNLFGAVKEGKMETDMYNHVLNGGSLTKEYLDNLALNANKMYYGKSVVIDKYSKNTWVNRSHYYMKFYLYNYAFCISVASYVAKKILDNDKEMLDNYIKFLSLGSNTWPIDAFKVLGVDLTESKVYEQAIQYFLEMIDKFESIYNSKED